MRTEQDIKNRKAANQRYYNLEENRQQKRDYMKSYRTRDYVKARSHEYYIVNKMHWGEIKKFKKRNWGGMRQENEAIRKLHEEWAIKNGYR